jgi:hypothetical protein
LAQVMNIVHALPDAASSYPSQANQLLEIAVFRDDLQSSPSGRRDLDFVEFVPRSLNHVVAKSPFAVSRFLALDSTAEVRELFALDFPTVLILAYRFVRLLCDEEARCWFVVQTPTFAAICGAQIGAIMPNIGQFLADDPALLATVIRAMGRVPMMAAKTDGRRGSGWCSSCRTLCHSSRRWQKRQARPFQQ